VAPGLGPGASGPGQLKDPHPVSSACRPGPRPATYRMIKSLWKLSVIAVVAVGCVGPPNPALEFDLVAQLDIGLNPHQISFSEDGRTAYVATAGENLITVIDAVTHEVAGTIDVPGTPLGVIPTPNGMDLAVARFEGGGVARYARSGAHLGGDRGTSAGASLITGPYTRDRYLVSVEQADSVHVFDAHAFTFVASFPTGDRPFPGAATADGRKAFVPGYADGTVTIIDLFNDRVLETVPVGTMPSGGAVLPGDIDYAVVVRGENRVAFINTASHQVVGELTEGIGESPFSLVISPNGRLAFVNNTVSHDISVIDLASRLVITRIPVPDTPIVMAVHPSGNTLWVSSEGVHRVTVLSIPEFWRGDPGDRPAASSGISSAAPNDSPAQAVAAPPTRVAVMGMIHSGHLTSQVWGLDQVISTVRAFDPDIVCAEIAPDRGERILRDLRERDAIEDPRVLRFPEYTDAILRLSVEMGFDVVPCAGWTQEMSDLRNARIAEFDSAEAWAESREAYALDLQTLQSGYSLGRGSIEDPAYIHSPAYDERQAEELRLYDLYQNDMIGPGGWTNINVEHYRLVDRAIREHPGARILVTFGGGHKYWLLDRLRLREDVELVDLGEFLP